MGNSFQKDEPEPVDLLVYQEILSLKLQLKSIKNDLHIIKEDIDCIRDKVC